VTKPGNLYFLVLLAQHKITWESNAVLPGAGLKDPTEVSICEYTQQELLKR